MFQKVIVVGYLGRDPEMRYLPDGSAVTDFSIATSRRWTNRNGQTVDETTWFRVSVWGRQAETANQYLTKGQMVLVEGRLRPDPQTGGPRTYTRQDGTVGASFELTADNFRFLSSKDGGAGTGGYREDSFDDSSGSSVEEDDIPF